MVCGVSGARARAGGGDGLVQASMWAWPSVRATDYLHSVAMSAGSGWEQPELEPSEAQIGAAVEVVFALED